jgi:hypothetical protein
MEYRWRGRAPWTTKKWRAALAVPQAHVMEDALDRVLPRIGGIGDGGFTDWTARLIANQKERLLISGLSTDRLAAIRSPAGRE